MWSPAREQLRVHLRRHKGMRKFQCPDCGYKFTRQVRIHFYPGRCVITEQCLFYFFNSQAHLRRHVQVHKRTENYNPRQRKLRNVIVQEVDINPSEQEPAEVVEASMTSDHTGYIPGAVEESRNPEPNTRGGLHPACVIDGMDSRHVVMEEVVTNQNLREDVAAESFSVSEVLQQSQMVESYRPSVQEMGQGTSESKT